MKFAKKIALRIAQIVVLLYLSLCAALYFYQESLIFPLTDLPPDFVFNFEEEFEEFTIPTADDATLSGLLFRADSSKGLIFYLHGNGGALNTWGKVAKTYTSRGYDVFLLDYRQYGKSSGEISSEAQFFDDVQQAYNLVKSNYEESQICVLGYSLGTAPAAMIAANNHPKQLILQAPYYSLVDMMQRNYAFVPTFLLKYRFEIASFMPQIKAPITIFHGDNDSIIYYGASLKLKAHFKPTDRLITLEGGRHNGMHDRADYLAHIEQVLAGR